MSIYNIYTDKKKNRIIKYDSKSNRVFWAKNKQGITLNAKSSEKLNEIMAEKIITKDEDINILSISKNNGLVRKRTSKGYEIYNNDNFIGILDISFGPQKIEKFRKNGGIIISYIDNDISKIVYYKIQGSSNMNNSMNENKHMVNNRRIMNEKISVNNSEIKTQKEKKCYTELREENSEYSNLIDKNYYEATIKIPIVKQSMQDEKIEKILELTKLTYDKIEKLENNFVKNVKSSGDATIIKQNKSMYNNLVNENIELKKKVYKLLKEKEESQEILNSLSNERKFLMKEIDKSRNFAINELKKELKPAIVNINSQLDLEKRNDIYNEILDIIKMYVPESEIGIVLGNNSLINGIREFSDNIDFKIQSLKEIKKLFEKIKILDSDRGVK